MIPDQVLSPGPKAQGNDPAGGNGGVMLKCTNCGKEMNSGMPKIVTGFGTFCSVDCAVAYDGKMTFNQSL